MGNIIISVHFPIFIFTIKNFTKKNYYSSRFSRKTKKDEIFRNLRGRMAEWQKRQKPEVFLSNIDEKPRLLFQWHFIRAANGSYVRVRKVNKSCDGKNYFVNNDLFKNLQINIFEVENVYIGSVKYRFSSIWRYSFSDLLFERPMAVMYAYAK